MHDIEEALSPYIPAASLDAFHDELPRPGDRDFPVGHVLWYLHTPVTKPYKVLMKLRCVGRDATDAKWIVTQQVAVEHV